MKKLLLLVVAVCTVSMAQAQTGGLQLGLKAGVNYATLTGDDVSGIDPKFGFHIGGYADYGVNDMFSIRPEVLFSGKGFKMEESESNVFESGDKYTIEMTQQLNYIDVPVLAHIKQGNFFFQAGPQISFLLSSKGTAKVTYKAADGTSESEEESDSSTDGLRSVGFGYALGAGYELSNGLALGLRYNGDFTSIAEDDDDGKVKNSVVQFSVSYRFSK
ncbi:porin family protein [Nibribacter koreensis]|uniref:Porin family protein n=1 Tax=Nibribacter koreensis TaxID=1084519 RepID=A0ABP8FVP3_9BACT